MNFECYFHVGNLRNPVPKTTYPPIQNFVYPKLRFVNECKGHHVSFEWHEQDADQPYFI